MATIDFVCPSCQRQQQTSSMHAGQVIACVNCQQSIQLPATFTVPSVNSSTAVSTGKSATHFPIIIRSSTRAMYARYLRSAICLVIGLIAVIALSSYLYSLKKREYNLIAISIWSLYGLWILMDIVRLILQYLRIKHTEFRLYQNKLESSSYLFQFLGVSNNVVNLTQLREIRAWSNSYLDLWFFHCGSVTLTVSGDTIDFVLTNIYQSGKVRRQIEAVAFGNGT